VEPAIVAPGVTNDFMSSAMFPRERVLQINGVTPAGASS